MGDEPMAVIRHGVVTCTTCGMGVNIELFDGPLFHSERYGHDATWNENDATLALELTHTTEDETDA